MSEQKKSKIGDALETSDVMSLVELRKFLADELTTSGTGSRFESAYTPMTDGLGLQSPPRAASTVAAPVAAPRPVENRPSELAKVLESSQQQQNDGIDRAFMESMRKARAQGPVPKPVVSTPIAEKPPAKPTQSLAQALALENTEMSSMASSPPPPVPKPTWFRRLLATLLDQAFILLVFTLAMLVTALFLSKEPGPVLQRISAEIENPLFVQFAVLEYITLWLAYLTIGVGLLDSTFGMWVWGLRISYGIEGKTSGGKKWLRILLSFFLVAPILTSLFLALRVKGKNLIDWLSGSQLYISLA